MKELTLGGGAKQDQAIVLVLAVTVEADLGIIGELKIEVESAGLKGVEEDGVRGFEGEVVEQDEDSATRRVFGREGDGENWEERN